MTYKEYYFKNHLSKDMCSMHRGLTLTIYFYHFNLILNETIFRYDPGTLSYTESSTHKLPRVCQINCILTNTKDTTYKRAFVF